MNVFEPCGLGDLWEEPVIHQVEHEFLSFHTTQWLNVNTAAVESIGVSERHGGVVPGLAFILIQPRGLKGFAPWGENLLLSGLGVSWR